jgi:hypothetical protein
MLREKLARLYSKSVAFFAVVVIFAMATTPVQARKYLNFFTSCANNQVPCISDWAVFTFPTAGGQIRWRVLKNENPSPPGAGMIFDIGWGQSATDLVPAPGDYTGNGVTDLNLYRNNNGSPANTYQILPINPDNQPPGGPIWRQWGSSLTDDIGAEGDYDGDGIQDPTAVRSNAGAHQWWVLNSSTSTVSVFQYGVVATDIPLPGADYDGDGTDDPAIARIGGNGAITFHIGTTSAQQISQVTWGNFDTDFIVPGGDYDGDNRADFMIWRAFGAGTDGIWYLRTSSGNISYTRFGIPGASATRDTALRGADYDGDGITDIAVYRPSTRTFWVNRSSGGVQTQEWGVAGNTNLPIASFGIF